MTSVEAEHAVRGSTRESVALLNSSSSALSHKSLNVGVSGEQYNNNANNNNNNNNDNRRYPRVERG